MNNNSILIVEDEIKIAEVVKSYLEHNGYIVLTSNNGRDAIKIFNDNKIDLIILDLMLPDLTGETVCTEIRKKSNVPIIILSAKSSEESILNGLGIGADDYVLKPFSPKQLVARVNAVLRRTNINMPKENKISFCNNDLIVNLENRTVLKEGKEVDLTASEYKILSTMISFKKKIFTREELIEIAFGIDYEGYERTIDSHIKNLRSKIESNSKKPVYIITVHGIGYKFGGE